MFLESFYEFSAFSIKIPGVLLNFQMAIVAQLVRALGCGPRGRGFKSRRSPLLEIRNDEL